MPPDTVHDNSRPRTRGQHLDRHRPNHGDYKVGRTPLQVKQVLSRRIRKTAA